jgi:hypothetical protein
VVWTHLNGDGAEKTDSEKYAKLKGADSWCCVEPRGGHKGEEGKRIPWSVHVNDDNQVDGLNEYVNQLIKGNVSKVDS